MARLFQAEIQIVGDDKSTTSKIQQILEKELKELKVEGVFVREVNLARELDEEDEYEEDSNN